MAELRESARGHPPACSTRSRRSTPNQRRCRARVLLLGEPGDVALRALPPGARVRARLRLRASQPLRNPGRRESDGLARAGIGALAALSDPASSCACRSAIAAAFAAQLHALRRRAADRLLALGGGRRSARGARARRSLRPLARTPGRLRAARARPSALRLGSAPRAGGGTRLRRVCAGCCGARRLWRRAVTRAISRAWPPSPQRWPTRCSRASRCRCDARSRWSRRARWRSRRRARRAPSIRSPPPRSGSWRSSRRRSSRRDPSSLSRRPPHWSPQRATLRHPSPARGPGSRRCCAATAAASLATAPIAAWHGLPAAPLALARQRAGGAVDRCRLDAGLARRRAAWPRFQPTPGWTSRCAPPPGSRS